MLYGFSPLAWTSIKNVCRAGHFDSPQLQWADEMLVILIHYGDERVNTIISDNYTLTNVWTWFQLTFSWFMNFQMMTVLKMCDFWRKCWSHTACGRSHVVWTSLCAWQWRRAEAVSQRRLSNYAAQFVSLLHLNPSREAFEVPFTTSFNIDCHCSQCLLKGQMMVLSPAHQMNEGLCYICGRLVMKRNYSNEHCMELVRWN